MNFTKIKEWYKSDKFPLMVFIILISIIHIFMRKVGDDLFFSASHKDIISFFQFLIERYNLWTSRIVIECILVGFCSFLPMTLWKIANIGMFYLLVYSLSKIFITKNKRTLNYILCISLICIPITVLREAGWMATMNNYLWVAATGVFAMIPIQKIYKNEKITLWQSVLLILATIYASNQEQMAGILFLVYTFFLIDIILKKKYKAILFIIYAIIILNLILILTCPGNENRKIDEEKNYYPGYSDLSLVKKLSQGLTSMMNYVVKSGRIPFLALLLLIAYVLWIGNNKKFYKFLGISPLVLSLGYREFSRILIEAGKEDFMKNTMLYIIFENIVYILILALIGICIYKIFSEKKGMKKIVPLFIYFVGIISRYVMAFSPTIYASGERTAYFWYISICILIVLIIKEKIIKFVPVQNSLE